MTAKPNKKYQRTKSLLIHGVILFAIYFAVQLYQTRATPSGQAPELHGILLDGQHLTSLAQLEKPVLVHFWATWCKICELEHNSINDIAQDHAVIAVASQSGDLSTVKRFTEKNHINYPSIVDIHGIHTKNWGIQGFPTSFIIDKNNHIRFTEVGLTSELGLRFRLWLATFF